MRSSKAIQIISCHAEGEVGDVIIGGVTPPPGETLWIGGRAAIIPSITGRAWITGTRQEMLDPEDPWPAGYRLSDTWPQISR